MNKVGMKIPNFTFAFSTENEPYEADTENEKGPYFAVEWDRQYTGGEYESAGEMAYIPIALLSKMSVEKAFEKWTGVNPIHIVHYSVDELFNSDGIVWGDCCEVCQRHEVVLSSCEKYNAICDDCLDDLKKGNI